MRSLILTLRKFSCSGGGQIRRGASLLGRGGEKKGAPLRNVCPRGPRAAERPDIRSEREGKQERRHTCVTGASAGSAAGWGDVGVCQIQGHRGVMD